MPYSPQFGDYYYSKSDGRLECDHVFIKGNDLQTRFETSDHITIGELGFGTGLNFLETMRQFRLMAKPEARLDFHSFELNPLDQSTIEKALVIWPELASQLSELLKLWPNSFQQYHEMVFAENIQLHLHIGDVNDTLPKIAFISDAWYLDGFTPARNQSMWSLELMNEIATHTVENGTFASYTAAGWVRRNLSDAGFDVRKSNGFAGKRDMICGFKKPKSA